VLFEAGQPNLYSYVGNDPVNWIDSEGLEGKQSRIPEYGEPRTNPFPELPPIEIPPIEVPQEPLDGPKDEYEKVLDVPDRVKPETENFGEKVKRIIKEICEAFQNLGEEDDPDQPPRPDDHP
jgi:hypothetical protein